MQHEVRCAEEEQEAEDTQRPHLRLDARVKCIEEALETYVTLHQLVHLARARARARAGGPRLGSVRARATLTRILSLAYALALALPLTYPYP